MSYIAITDAEIAAGKPLKSDILARLRDNPAEVLCDPPGSTTLKLRPSMFVLDSYYDFDYTTGKSIVISDSNNAGELCVMELQVRFNTNASANPLMSWSSTCACMLLVSAIPKYSGNTPTAVRFMRRAVPVAAIGTKSGTLETNAWVDIPLTNTWTAIFTWTNGGQSPTVEVRASLVGTQVKVEARKVNTYSGRVFLGWSGYLLHLEYKNS